MSRVANWTFSGLMVLVVIAFVAASIHGGLIREGEPKAYLVSSATPEGQAFIVRNKVKYIHKDVWTFFGFDTSKGDGFYAAEVTGDNWFLVETLQYRPIPEKVVQQFQLRVDYAFPERYGYLGWVIMLLMVGVGLYMNR